MSRFFGLSTKMLLAGLVASAAVRAEDAGAPAGDAPQVPLPSVRTIVPLPPLGPAEEARTFRLAPGFRIELVAAEPVVRDPVAAAFDGQSNLWVAEITGFNAGMLQLVPSLAGSATRVPAGSIVKLESSRHDGHYDRRTVFLTGLVAPRALAVVRGGVLVGDPPHLWLARDTDGDGKCDEKTLLADDYGVDLVNESNANGLLWGRDNVLHNICYDFDFRYRDGHIERLPVQVRGEYGLTQDDAGRLYFNRNSDQLRCDLFPQAYTVRNPDLPAAPWANVRIAASQQVWPSHPNPVVNRGYRHGVLGESNGGLRDDGTLLEFTATCSPLIYRGAQFPREFYGNAFVPEPAANLIKRDLLAEKEGRLAATDAYSGKEFLTSTDSRFRPVNLNNAPDGSMLVVDLYRGVLEEFHLDTPYLIQQSALRGLAEPMFGRGRIWRIVREGAPASPPVDLDRLTGAELARRLEDPNGWWRDAAQQALVEQGGRTAVPELERIARQGASPVSRLAALWTLDGLGAATPAILEGALGDRDPQVRSAAIRLHEAQLRGPDAEAAIDRLIPLARDPAPEVVVQLALSLGEAKSEAGLRALDRAFQAQSAHPYMAAAVVSGLRGREQTFLPLVESDVQGRPSPAVVALTTQLAAAIAHSGDVERVRNLIARASSPDHPEWERLAIVAGIGSLTQPAFRRTVAPGRLVKAAALAPLTAAADPAVRQAAGRVAARFSALEAQAAARAHAARPLNPDERKLADAGGVTFQICAGCHQASGQGMVNVAPSLVESPWVAADPQILVRIVLAGKEGTPGFPGAMPPVGVGFSDEQIAGVLSYVRNSWGLSYGPVSPALVARVRHDAGGRARAWTNAELTEEAKELAKAALRP